MYTDLLEQFENNLFKNVDRIAELPDLDITMLDSSQTVLVIINMTNQYLNDDTGACHDIAAMVSPVSKLLEICCAHNVKSILFRDVHDENSTEFSYFPKHSIRGSNDTEVCSELAKTGGFEIIDKNSINGFHAPGFQKFLKDNNIITNFIVCGAETDMSVMNFCLTLKTYFDQQNIDVNIIIPYTAIETFDYGAHNNDISNILSIQHMASQGIEFVKEIV